MKIAVVDDSKSVHNYITGILQSKNGIELLNFYDGHEVIERLQATKSSICDLILLDWEMPNLSGLDTLIKIRELNIDTPIVMVTSKNSIECIKEAMENGANDYLMKPFTEEMLNDKLDYFLSV